MHPKSDRNSPRDEYVSQAPVAIPELELSDLSRLKDAGADIATLRGVALQITNEKRNAMMEQGQAFLKMPAGLTEEVILSGLLIPPDILRGLTRLLENREATVRRDAAIVVKNLGSDCNNIIMKEQLEYLIENDPEPEVRKAAEEAFKACIILDKL